MASFNDFWRTLSDGLAKLAKDSYKDFAKEATADGKAFLNRCKEDLKRWTKQLAAGDLSKRDFEDLVKGQADVAKLVALKQAGLAAVRIEKFQRAVIDLVVNTAVDTFL